MYLLDFSVMHDVHEHISNNGNSFHHTTNLATTKSSFAQ